MWTLKKKELDLTLYLLPQILHLNSVPSEEHDLTSWQFSSQHLYSDFNSLFCLKKVFVSCKLLQI